VRTMLTIEDKLIKDKTLHQEDSQSSLDSSGLLNIQN
jgi:hypothetical protein